MLGSCHSVNGCGIGMIYVWNNLKQQHKSHYRNKKIKFKRTKGHLGREIVIIKILEHRLKVLNEELGRAINATGETLFFMLKASQVYKSVFQISGPNNCVFSKFKVCYIVCVHVVIGEWWENTRGKKHCLGFYGDHSEFWKNVSINNE